MNISKLLLVFFTQIIFCQNQYPKNYFVSPLDIPLQLSGNFGELRPNHFHSGFDFKTQGLEGLKVYAAAEGYISRIKISEDGYGKAIYITHPNGFTTVYGHLQSGFGTIESYIKKKQYEFKSYEIEVFPNANELIVKKGDTIAVSGNTGGSSGPHLHFEIRDTKSEKIINPLFFGFDENITDSKPPVLNSLFVYPLNDETIVNNSRKSFLLDVSEQKDGTYLSEKVFANDKIGFGISADDFDNVSWNKNGIFKVETFLNGKPDLRYQFDTFSFDESKYVNALIDYSYYKSTGQRIQKLFAKVIYPLTIVDFGIDKGVVQVTPNLEQNYRIEVSDFNGNVTIINIPIQFSNKFSKIKEVISKPKYFLYASRDNIFKKDNVTVNFKEDTFLEDFYFDMEVKENKLQLFKDIFPAFKNFSIIFEKNNETQKDKFFIGLVDGKKIKYFDTKYRENSFTIFTKYLGEYKLLKDTIAPTVRITKAIEGKWISNQKELQFVISDDLSGVNSYNGYLNGEWILFEYETKTKKLTHNFSDGLVREGKNELKLVVTDNVGNSTIFETQFFRSQKP